MRRKCLSGVFASGRVSKLLVGNLDDPKVLARYLEANGWEPSLMFWKYL